MYIVLALTALCDFKNFLLCGVEDFQKIKDFAAEAAKGLSVRELEKLIAAGTKPVKSEKPKQPARSLKNDEFTKFSITTQEQFKSVYDIFLSKPNGTIPVGSSTIIKIDPNSPEHIMGDSKRSGTGFVTVGIILLLVMIIPLMIIKTGLVNEGELRMSGIGAPKYERMISDDLITKEYGSDWYIEKLKISSVTEEQEGDLKYLHVIVDDSFKEINTSTDFGYSEGEEVYVIYHMITVDGELKKEALNFVAAEGTGYTGAHKAYR